MYPKVVTVVIRNETVVTTNAFSRLKSEHDAWGLGSQGPTGQPEGIRERGLADTISQDLLINIILLLYVIGTGQALPSAGRHPAPDTQILGDNQNVSQIFRKEYT